MSQSGRQVLRPSTVTRSEVERHQLSVCLDYQDFQGAPCHLVPAHPRSVRRHAGKGKPDDIRAILKQFDDRFRWNVPFDYIAIHQCRMARCRVRRHAVLSLEFGDLWIFGEIDDGSSFL